MKPAPEDPLPEPLRRAGHVVIGLDVAQERFETAFLCNESGRVLLRQGFANDAEGWAGLLRLVRPLKKAHLVMEATGNYHAGLLHAIEQAGLTASAVNPLQIKRFGQMKLRRVKTDRSDAHLIADYGREQKPPVHRAAAPEQQELRQIASLVEQLTKQRTALKNMAHAGSLLPRASGACKEVLEQQIRSIEESLKRLEAEQDRLVKSAYSEVRRLAESVSGVGRKTATALVAYAGDLSRFESAKQLAAFVGLNPVPRQSGKALNAQMHISKQGHAALRTLFYMGAQSARRHNRSCRALYERLIAAGKRKKVALVAVANKMLRQVFAVVKSGVPFDDRYGFESTPAP